MKPTFYLNLRVHERARVSSNSIMASTVQLIHAFMQRKEVKLALAFPGAVVGDQRSAGNRIRVFSDSRELLDILGDDIETSSLSEVVHIFRVRPVPETVDRFVEYRRFRIRRMDTNANLRRNQQIDQSHLLPALKIRSKSNGCSFLLMFDVIERPQAEVQTTAVYRSNPGEGPDGYGLSVPDRPFALPCLVD